MELFILIYFIIVAHLKKKEDLQRAVRIFKYHYYYD